MINWRYIVYPIGIVCWYYLMYKLYKKSQGFVQKKFKASEEQERDSIEGTNNSEN